MQQVTQLSFPLINIDLIQCCSGNLATSLCCSKKCQTFLPFICSNTQCGCAQNHKQCDLIDLRTIFDEIQAKRKIKSSQQKQNFEIVKKIYQDMYEAVSDSYKQFEESIDAFGLGPIAAKFINLLTTQQLFLLNGKLVDEMRNQMKNVKIDGNLYEGRLQLLKNSLNTNIQMLKCSVTEIYQEVNQKLLSKYSKLYNKQKHQICDENFGSIAIFEEWLNQGKKLINIQALVLTNTSFDRIPIEIDLMRNLKKLWMSSGQIVCIQNLNNLSSLNWLCLANNKINKIENISNLKSLNNLDLSINKIRTIQNIQSVQNLQILSLNENLISKLQNLRTLKKLKTVNLYQNKLKLENLEDDEKKQLEMLQLQGTKVILIKL